MTSDAITRAAYLTPWHGALNIARLLAWHAAVVLWAWLGWDHLAWPWYVAGGALICLAHQREMNDWSHEACHWNLHPNRTMNEVLGNLLASFWFVVPLASLRNTHFRHHATETFFVPDDPDTGGLKVSTRKELILGVLADLSGLGAIGHYLSYVLGHTRARARPGEKAVGSPWPMAAVLAGHAALFAALVWLGRWQTYVLYYAVLVTLYRLSHRIRIYGQHLALNEDGTGFCDGSTVSRTVVGGPIDKLVFASNVMLYHNEHHSRPELPYRALRVMCRREHDRNRYVERRRPVLGALWNLG